MPRPNVYIHPGDNDGLDAFQVCEWTGCKARPGWVVHSDFRIESGEDEKEGGKRIKTCKETFWCERHFPLQFPPASKAVDGITFIEFDLWVAGKKQKKAGKKK